MPSHVIALDQGTTSSRTIAFTADGRPAAVAQRAIPQLYPSPGHVEHDPEVIWRTQRGTMTVAMRESRARAEDIAAIGIGNQRETVLLWEKRTGRPVHNAIVWQSRITADLCDRLRADGCEDTVRERTGLCLDPYFSGTKIRYLLDRDPELRRRAERGEVLAGTIDTWLIWRLTRGRVHATDVSNASRTLLFNIHTLDWDDTLLEMLGVPRAMLPEVRDSSGFFGETDRKTLGACIPITGVAGDQQAATFGQGCLRPGMAKSTYGTGCFILMNTASKPVPSANGLLTTVGWRIRGKTTYCLEGAVFIGGAAVQWLRDGLGVIRSSADVERVAASVPDSGGVFFVPAFVGLGAPHWDPYARGILVGIERGTTAGHVARAALEAMAFQCADVIDAMAADAGTRLKELRVDGGAAVNDGLMQFQADVLGVKALRPAVTETTALGAACLAGLAVGFWKNQAEVQASWTLDRAFRPAMKPDERATRRARWSDAVARSRGWARP